MSVHIGAKKGDISAVVLLPGDPLRARHIAHEMFNDTVQYNTVRNMEGYTGEVILPDIGTFRVSAQGSGMGMPSLSIYTNELFTEYNVQTIIRVGTCGALQDHLKPGDIVLAQGACSESGMNRRRFRGMDYAPLSHAELLLNAVLSAQELKMLPVHVGNVLSADLFYNDYDKNEWKMWSAAGVLAVEMESAELYTLAAQAKRQALSILTVSDVLATGEQMTALERENCFHKMVQIALLAAFKQRFSPSI